MSAESHVFMNKDVLLEVLATSAYGKPVVCQIERKPDAADNEEEAVEFSQEITFSGRDVVVQEGGLRDERVGYKWGNRTLKKALKTVIPGWDVKDANGMPKRRFGTHTAKKTGVQMYVIAGQLEVVGGKEVITQLNHADFCKVFRFCEETMQKYYMRK